MNDTPRLNFLNHRQKQNCNSSLVFLCVFVLSSCGSKYGQKNAYLEASAAESSGGCGGGSTFAIKSDWLIEQIENGVDSAVNDYFEYIRRFSETLDPGMSRRQLQKEIRALQGFEEQVSSRVAGMKQIERQRIKTMTEAGLDPNTARSKDFYDFLNSKTYEELLKSFTSEDIIEEYDRKARKEKTSGEEIAESFRNYLENETGRISLKGLRKSLGTTTIRKKKRFRAKKTRKKRTHCFVSLESYDNGKCRSL